VAPLLLLGLACADAETPRADDLPLLADAGRVEVLTEAKALSGPRSERPNRFSQGWIPTEVDGREALRAAPDGATLEIVTLTPHVRKLVMDPMAEDETLGPRRVQVRVDDGPPTLVPFADPLSVSLPKDLSPGRHRVELSTASPGEPPVILAQATVRPAPAEGTVRVEDGSLVLAGPSAAHVLAEPRKGWALLGEVCPGRPLGSTRGAAVELTGLDESTIGRWTGGGGLLDRLRGCRRLELAPVPTTGPVRVTFRAIEAGSVLRWPGWHWQPASAPRPANAGEASPPSSEADGSPPPRPPRVVVLYVFDALRADTVGHLGGPSGISPTIDRLAREGFTFRDHRSTAPNTLLSIRHLFTGRILIDGEAWSRVGAHLSTLAEAFRAAGYRTGLFSANGYVSAHYGLARGFEHVSKEALFDGGPPDSTEVNRSAERAHDAALAWLTTLPEDAPVFLYLHTIHPHNPYSPPPDLAARYTGGIASTIHGDTRTLRDLLRGRRTATAADRERLRGLYRASLAYNDRELARFLRALRRKYPEQETVVVLTADHGEELFDHGGVLHGYTLYEELLHVPLVVWAPGAVRPGETDDVTDALDLHATLLDLAGATGAGESEGRSLLGLLRGRAEALPPTLHFAASEGIPGGIFAVRADRWKYVWARGTERTWAMGLGPARSWDREYLFDLDEDPGETRNLASGFSVREDWLRTRLRAWVEAQLAEIRSGATPGEEESPLDPSELQRLRALGYVD
jgi:arylsulfatase A-like enzyme